MNLSLKLARLEHVPEDSSIYVPGNKIRKVLFGIDAGVPELLLARELDYDAVIAHHPQGEDAVINSHQVFRRHIEQMVNVGIPREKAEKAVEKKLQRLEIQGHTRNYAHAVDVAKLLKMPYMNIHTPLDEVGRRKMGEQIEDKTGEEATVQDVVTVLKALPEFGNAVTAIQIRLGKDKNPAGKVVVSHGAGTNGGYEIAKEYFRHGIGTLVYIHISPRDLERLKVDGTGNLIVTGHIAGDSVGINPLIHELEKRYVSVTRMGVVLD
jgi:hypothetical protein